MGKSTGTPLVLKNDQGLDVIAEEQGKEIKYTKDYGCGIDVHSRMIAVSVLVKRDLAVYEYHRNFSTDQGCCKVDEFRNEAERQMVEIPGFSLI